MANGPITSEDLRLGIERIERLEEEKKAISDDIKDVYSEYKSKGFCTKTMKRIVALRKLTPDDRRELEAAVRRQVDVLLSEQDLDRASMLVVDRGDVGVHGSPSGREAR